MFIKSNDVFKRIFLTSADPVMHWNGAFNVAQMTCKVALNLQYMPVYDRVRTVPEAAVVTCKEELRLLNQLLQKRNVLL